MGGLCPIQRGQRCQAKVYLSLVYDYQYSSQRFRGQRGPTKVSMHFIMGDLYACQKDLTKVSMHFIVGDLYAGQRGPTKVCVIHCG